MQGIYQTLDPVRLKRQVELLQDALWRHAVFGRVNQPLHDDGAPPLDVRFSLDACEQADDLTARTDAAPSGGKRKYRRTQKIRGPRTYRTRSDPFEADWEEITTWLAAKPEHTAKSIFEELQRRTECRYSRGQLRTLQRRVKEWRAHAILVFDYQWLAANDALHAEPGEELRQPLSFGAS